MELAKVKGIWESEGNKFIILFVKNGHKYPIYTKSSQIFTNWKEALRRVVLCCDFHDEYSVSK